MKSKENIKPFMSKNMPFLSSIGGTLDKKDMFLDKKGMFYL